MTKGLGVPGMIFGLTFYFTCPEGHVHPVEVKFSDIIKEGLTVEALTKLQVDIRNAMPSPMRISTEIEIADYIMLNEMGEMKAPDGYVMAPGTRTVQ